MSRVDWREVKLLLLDSDGVLTDGGVYYSSSGEELRRFNIKDGAGVRRLMKLGVCVGIVSGSSTRCVLHRARQLGIEEIHIGVEDKADKVRQIAARRGIDLSQVAYLGDDLADIPVLKTVGFPCAVCDAIEQVRQVACYATSKAGGHGAVRELCDWIVQAWQGERSCLASSE